MPARLRKLRPSMPWRCLRAGLRRGERPGSLPGPVWNPALRPGRPAFGQGKRQKRLERESRVLWLEAWPGTCRARLRARMWVRLRARLRVWLRARLRVRMRARGLFLRKPQGGQGRPLAGRGRRTGRGSV